MKEGSWAEREEVNNAKFLHEPPCRQGELKFNQKVKVTKLPSFLDYLFAHS